MSGDDTVTTTKANINAWCRDQYWIGLVSGVFAGIPIGMILWSILK